MDHFWEIVLIIVVGTPLAKGFMFHLQKMAELRVRSGQALGVEVLRAQTAAPARSGEIKEIKADLAALRDEVAALRDTSTRFDMSFDAALTRLEDRVDHIGNQTGERYVPLHQR